MPWKNPKVQGGAGFGFFQVFAHSTYNLRQRQKKNMAEESETDDDDDDGEIIIYLNRDK